VPSRVIAILNESQKFYNYANREYLFLFSITTNINFIALNI